MKPEEKWDDDGVIDAAAWLERRVESLIETQRFQEAIGYLRRLNLKVMDEDRRKTCGLYLGYLYLLEGDIDRSQRWLKSAAQLSGADPHVAYAFGHAAAAKRSYSEAALYFLEAFAEGDATHDEAEFLRCAALSLVQAQGPVEPVAAMLLGALDRDLGNPWILDALARVYEADERWMESLKTLSVLSKVVRRARSSVVVYRTPKLRQLLRNRLMGDPANPEELKRRAQAINEAVRRQFEVVLDDGQRRGPTGLALLHYPTALGRLLRILEWQDRSLELVEAAQTLWARATGKDFDEMLGTARLAAAIQVLVERLHWRTPTPLSEVARWHGASPAAIPAAARVVAGSLGLELFNEAALKNTLNFEDRRRLEELHRALLFGESLRELRGEIRLGG